MAENAEVMAALATALWNKPTADLTTTGSVGKHVVELTSGDGGESLTPDQSTKLDNIDTRTNNMDSRVTPGRAGNLDNLDAAVSAYRARSPPRRKPR